MQIGRIKKQTKVEGPGTRTAIWLQGCSINCEDCCNQQFIPFNQGDIFTPEQLLKEINDSEIEGITILGGEPLDQHEELSRFFTLVKNETKLGIILFTGYDWPKIEACNNYSQAIKNVDLVIAGPFKKELSPDSRRWIGSSNQTTHFITDRYAELKKSWPPHKIELEIEIKDAELVMTGTPIELFPDIIDI